MEIKKIQRVVKSTIAAETLALQEALETCYMIRTILLELYKKETDNGLFPIHCYTDNKLLLDSIGSVHPSLLTSVWVFLWNLIIRFLWILPGC